MAGKFVVMKEAAAMLGVSPDELNELRSAGEIHGYRDGASWKFKLEEVERFASERGIEFSEGGGKAPTHASDELINVADLEDDESSDFDESVLVTEEELGQSGDATSSTVIGNKGAPGIDAESDITLSSDEPAKQGGVESDLRLIDSDEDIGLGEAEVGVSALDEDDDFSLSDDDELVLAGGSGKGSDITLGTADSGINLASPTDSGLSLEEEPLDLGGSTPGSSLELPEDEDVIALDEEAEVKQDEEFMLSPSGDMSVEESDSGSQVIALEESTEFDESSSIVQVGEGLLEEDAVQPLEPVDSFAPAVDVGGVAPPMGRYEPAEASYSVANVLGLGIVVLALGLSGIMMTDLVRNMWTWQQPYSATHTLMDQIVEGVGLAD